ncbi:MAG: protein translocase subunit SecD [Lachnospiraceae bacterium]|nr:protein translocase subunit SecD [Lachnospiraceae bacterium]
MKKSKAIVTLLLTLGVTGLLLYMAAYGVGENSFGAAKDINLGLDLAGGVSITYQAVGDEEPSAEDMADTIYKLQKRVESYSTEAEVYQEGSDRINIEIPGVSDANEILSELGQPGSLEFQTTDGEVVLEGTDVSNAQAGSTTDSLGNKSYVVELTLTDEGAEKFAEATAANVGYQISIVYDGEVISSPIVNEAITDGRCQISGSFTYEEADQLASTIRIGSLSLELEELRSNVVGAKLGEEAIETSLLAGAIGFGLVILFMLIAYRIMGLAAGVALTTYVALVLVLLNGFDMTLTLPGIAGIILSIGMAVDANVIIFARVREEIATGKTIRTSIKIGFKKALSAIVDGNITTLIAAAVLAVMGTGSVKGFAQTLALGIVVSMFTALVVTRLVLNALYGLGIHDAKWYGAAKERKAVNFLGKRKIFFTVSLAIIVIGIGYMGFNAASGNGLLAYGLEFQGGTSTTVEFNEDMTIEEIDEQVVPLVAEVVGNNDIQTQKVSGSTQVVIKTTELDLETRTELDERLTEEFELGDDAITAESISGVISSEMRSDAIISVIVATVCMLLYIWIRFKDLRFAASAVAALLHDVLIVLVFYGAARISVGNTFIACMLTIVGYSINATIVIFDRIRENLGEMKKKDSLEELVNNSITQTLTRSIYTSLTTFIMVAVLFILGVASIREFALPLMVGIACGAYSSVCITGALWYLMKTKIRSAESED